MVGWRYRTDVSILGDSISTYSGYNPKGYAVYYDKHACKANNLETVDDTWWSIVLKELGAELCVNGSYSGSTVSGEDFPAAESSERIEVLHYGDIMPDVILIYIGFNDFALAVDMDEFKNAYEHMLEQLKQKYPESRIICATLMPTYIRNYPLWKFPEYNNGVRMDDYNEAIRSACRKQEVILADLADTGISYETIDVAHPTYKGHAEIAGAWGGFPCGNGSIVDKSIQS